MKFEDNLKQLEELVRKMESGALSLDEMIAAFENGRRVVGTGQKGLESIGRRVGRVTADGPKPVEIVTNANGEPDIAL